MGAYVATNVLHKIGWYYEQAGQGTARLGALLLVSAGLQGDATLADHATLAPLLAASNDEANFAGYARQTLPAGTVTVDTVSDRVLLAFAGAPPLTITWPGAGIAGGPLAAGQNNLIGKIVWYFDPNPAGSTDAQRIHLGGADVSFTTDGTTLVVTLGADGMQLARRPG